MLATNGEICQYPPEQRKSLMAEPTVLAVPIELTDAELDVVFGASRRFSLFGGQLTLGGGSGPTAFSGTVTIITPADPSSDPVSVSFAEGRSGAYVLLESGQPPVIGTGSRRTA
jgi:hypothetical protein